MTEPLDQALRYILLLRDTLTKCQQGETPDPTIFPDMSFLEQLPPERLAVLNEILELTEKISKELDVKIIESEKFLKDFRVQTEGVSKYLSKKRTHL